MPGFVLRFDVALLTLSQNITWSQEVIHILHLFR
jgi:hypothetical protein